MTEVGNAAVAAPHGALLFTELSLLQQRTRDSRWFREQTHARHYRSTCHDGGAQANGVRESSPVAQDTWRAVFKHHAAQALVDECQIKGTESTHVSCGDVPWVHQPRIPADTKHALLSRIRCNKVRSRMMPSTCVHPSLLTTPYLRINPLSSEIPAFWKLLQEMQLRARLQALKAHDTDAYVAHLEHAKLSSLLHIMEVTHRFMLRIGAELHTQQAKATSASATAATAATTASVHPNQSTAMNLHQRQDKRGTGGDARLHAESSATVTASRDFERFKEYVASTKDEYQLVHKKSVFVAEQPRGLDATLMPHQLVGLRFLASLQANNINGILADEMGVGKTLQTISFLLYLKESQSAVRGPHLILAPLSIIREWREACAQFASRSIRCAELQEIDCSDKGSVTAFDIVLLPIHRVRALPQRLMHLSWGFLVVDEAHKAVANLNTVTAQAISSIRSQHRLVLTGTPLNSDLQELWSLLHFINPQIFSEADSFDDVFRRPFQALGSDDQKDAHVAKLTDEEQALLVMRLHQVLRPFMLRRTKKDIDHSLRISFHTVRCPLTAPQQRLLARLREKREIPTVIDGKYTARSILTAETTAQSICNHAFMIPFFSQVLQRDAGLSSGGDHGGPPSQMRSRCDVGECAAVDGVTHMTLACSGKFLVLDWILRRARACGTKAVVFTHWLDTMDLLTEYFEAIGWCANEDFVALSGATSASERAACVAQFRTNPKCFVFLVSVKAGGCGLNLQVAHLVLMLDKDYTTTNEDQAIARVFRIGQQYVVRAVHLVTDDPCENRIAVIADRKNKPRTAIIEGGGYHVEAVTDEERMEVLKGAMTAGAASDGEIDVSLPDKFYANPSLFDDLLIPTAAVITDRGADLRDVATAARQALAVCAVGPHRGFFDAHETPRILRDALDASEREDTDLNALGRGKRARNEFSADDFPPDWFWERLCDEGCEDEEIHLRWRAKMSKERELASLCDTRFARAPLSEICVTEARKRMPLLSVGRPPLD